MHIVYREYVFKLSSAMSYVLEIFIFNGFSYFVTSVVSQLVSQLVSQPVKFLMQHRSINKDMFEQTKLIGNIENRQQTNEPSQYCVATLRRLWKEVIISNPSLHKCSLGFESWSCRTFLSYCGCKFRTVVLSKRPSSPQSQFTSG